MGGMTSFPLDPMKVQNASIAILAQGSLREHRILTHPPAPWGAMPFGSFRLVGTILAWGAGGIARVPSVRISSKRVFLWLLMELPAMISLVEGSVFLL